MLYITLGDQPSGIYEGQVIDVCHFLAEHFDENVRLMSLISFRGFKKNKTKIKARFPKAIVLPMIPQLKNWRLNTLAIELVCRYYKERNVVGRNVLATKAALILKKRGVLRKVCFDGRGAIAAEWEEYDVVQDQALKNQIAKLEKEVVLQSDFRIGVSNALVQYWKERFSYSSDKHVVIPCTLSTNFKTRLPSKEKILNNRQELGYSVDDVILVYAGSTAGWQSFNLLQEFLSPLLKSNRDIKVLFLSKEDKNNTLLKESFPDQVNVQWVGSDEVNNFLTIADYGMLLREESLTNRVASPTKFAEYLISGLPVLISQNLGDYSQFVEANACGKVLGPGSEKPEFSSVSYTEKERLNNLGKKYFIKSSLEIKEQYKKLICSFYK